MKFNESIKNYDDFLQKIWIPIKNIFKNDQGVSIINLKKLYFIISNYYNNSNIIDDEIIFLEKIQYRLSYILPSLWFHQIFLNSNFAVALNDINNWGKSEIINSNIDITNNINKDNNIQDVVGLTNTSDQVTQSWNLIPDLTKNKGDFLIEKNFNLSKILDKIESIYKTNKITQVSRTNLIKNFTDNLNKIIVNNHYLIIKNLESLFVRWIAI